AGSSSSPMAERLPPAEGSLRGCLGLRAMLLVEELPERFTGDGSWRAKQPAMARSIAAWRPRPPLAGGRERPRFYPPKLWIKLWLLRCCPRSVLGNSTLLLSCAFFRQKSSRC